MRFSSTFRLVLSTALLGIPAVAQPALYNTVKQKLLEGKQVFSFTQIKNDPQGYCEAAKHYDYTWFEMQHSTLEFKDIEAMIAACPHVPAIPMIRLPDAQEWHIQHATDIGVLGIVVPTVDDVDRAPAIKPALREAAGPGAAVSDWTEKNQEYFGALQVEHNVMFLILALLVLIASLNIISALVMLVKNKARDIAILRTIGARQGSILRIFFLCGSAIGAMGTAAGVLIGVLFCAFIDLVAAIAIPSLMMLGFILSGT